MYQDLYYCPRCTYPLQFAQAGQVYVVHCVRCRGTFFDWGKTWQTLGPAADPTMWPKQAFTRPPRPGALQCPYRHGPMWSHELAYEKKVVEVDTCGTCHGLWLDAHEHLLLTEITQSVQKESAEPGHQLGRLGTAGTHLLQLVTLLPIEAHAPLKRRPWAVYSLIASLLVLFVIEMASIGDDPNFLKRWALIPTELETGAVHTLLTHAFLHASLPHILGNLYFLWVFGDNVEDFLGKKRFWVLYLASAIAGGLAHWLGNLHTPDPMVGASGAIAGLMGAYLVLFPRVKMWVVLFVRFKVSAIYYLLFWIGTQFLIMMNKDSHVAWLAHVGGFAAGAAIAYAYKRVGPPDGETTYSRRPSEL